MFRDAVQTAELELSDHKLRCDSETGKFENFEETYEKSGTGTNSRRTAISRE